MATNEVLRTDISELQSIPDLLHLAEEVKGFQAAEGAHP